LIRDSKTEGAIAQWFSGRRGMSVALILYPVVTLLARSVVFFVPFDSETVTRFIQEFLFKGNATFAWTLGESLRWGLVRPLYSLTFLLDFLMYGTDYRFYHLTDFLLSWATLAVIASLLLRSWSRTAAWLTLIFWMLLPAQGWSMFTFTGRNDRLAALFLLLAVREADRWLVRGAGQAGQIRMALYFLAGFLSKESAIAGFALPFAWLVIWGGWSIREVLGRTKTAWISAIAIPTIGFGIRSMMSLPLGDVGPLNTGTAYLAQFGRFVLEGTGLSFFIDTVPAGAVAIATLAAATLVRRLPREVRFGAFLCLCTIAPFAFVWIQHSFHWLPSLGYSMILAGLLSWRGRIPAGLRTALAIALVAFFAVWGSVETSRICGRMMTYRQAVDLVVARGDRVIDGARIVSDCPDLAELLGYASETDDPRVAGKTRVYIENLVQVSLEDSSATIVWPAPSFR